MIDDPVYPPVEAILEAHHVLIDLYGGVHGLRDEGGVEAALARGEQIRAYAAEPPTIFQIAAAVAYGFTRIQHPFIDGNKRIGMAVLFIILDLNGFYLDASETETADIFEQVADGSLTEDAFVQWVLVNTVEMENPEEP